MQWFDSMVRPAVSMITTHTHTHTQEEDQVRKGLKEPREMVTPALRQSLTKQGVCVCG